MDSDIAAFLAMLDRNGCGDWPFYINEGGNYCPFNIPQEGISPYIVHSANPWYFGPLSYHIGRAERIASAFSARNWLIALKYQDRVACMEDFFTPSHYMDIDFTPRPYEKMPNTLGRLLGNASFYRDIRFAPYVRCYVFKEDKSGSPVAAIWGYKESVDRWKEDPPLYKFAFGTQDLKFIDLMENEVSYPKESDGRTVLPMSPFPLFIKGMPGTEQKLCDAIASAILAAGATGGVEVAAFPTAEGWASIVFKNTFSREYSGDAKIIINGAESKFSLKMPSLGSREEQVALTHAAEYGVLQKFSAEYTFTGGSSGKISGDYVLLKNNQASITVDGDLSDWKGLPSIDLGEGISMKAVVADKKVLIAIRANVKDIPAGDVFSGVGLYIDPFEKTETWVEPKTAAGGIAGNLGVYELRKSKDGGLEALCRFSQGMLAGMDKDLMIVGEVQKSITAKAALSGDGAGMEIEIPEKIFAPLTLGAGSRFGLNISVPLKDGGIATLVPISGYVSVAEPGKINFVMMVTEKSPLRASGQPAQTNVSFAGYRALLLKSDIAWNAWDSTMYGALQRRGMEVVWGEDAAIDNPSSLAQYDLIATNIRRLFTPAQLETLKAFLASGGAIYVTTTPCSGGNELINNDFLHLCGAASYSVSKLTNITLLDGPLTEGFGQIKLLLPAWSGHALNDEGVRCDVVCNDRRDFGGQRQRRQEFGYSERTRTGSDCITKC